MADETKTLGAETRAVTGAITSMGLAEMISNLAIGIAKGQAELDFECMKIARFMGDAQVAFGKRPGSNESEFYSLVELGFTPNFYQFVDTVLELRVAVSTKFEEAVENATSLTQLAQSEAEQTVAQSAKSQSSYASQGSSWGWGWWNGSSSSWSSSGSRTAESSASSSAKQKNLALTTVDAKYASTYNYAIEASSLVKTKIVPVPPPTVLEEIIRAKVKERRDWLRLLDEAKAVFQGQKDTVGAMRTDANSLVALLDDERAALPGKLTANVTKLKEGLGSLSDQHWGLGGIAMDRTAIKSHVDAIDEATKGIAAFYAGTAGATDGFDTLRSTLIDKLTAYQTKLDAVLGITTTQPATP